MLFHDKNKLRTCGCSGSAIVQFPRSQSNDEKAEDRLNAWTLAKSVRAVSNMSPRLRRGPRWCGSGSVSASKKSCSGMTGGVGLLRLPHQEMTPALSSDCTCRSGLFCVGPRGGHYCLSDRGKKSYLKK